MGTGKNHAASLKGQLVGIEGSGRLGFWSDDSCNHISGYDPGTLPIPVNKESSQLEYHEIMSL
jgi:hypothetical protein